jgi:cytochrome P450
LIADEPPIPPFAPRPARPLPILSFLLTASRNSLAICDERVYRELFVRRDVFGYSIVFVSDPAGVKRVLLDNAANYRESPVKLRLLTPGLGKGLLTTESAEWQRHRRLIAPIMANQAVAATIPQMTRLTEALAERLTDLAGAGPIDLQREMNVALRRNLSELLFGPAPTEHPLLSLLNMHSPTPKLLDLVPLRAAPRPKDRQRRAAFDDMLRAMIARRRAENGGERDVLQELIDARAPESGDALGDDEICDEVATLIYGGLNTALRTLCWLWYLLAMHPWAEAKLHEELERVLGGRAPEANDLPKLVYTRKVIEEAMRLYPSIPLMIRNAAADDEVCGQRVPRGAYVLVVPYVIHRHRALWESPDLFDPERFAPKNVGKRHRFAFLPFSAGPRTCVAAALSRTEMTILVAVLAQRCRFHLVPGHRVTPVGKSTTLRAQGGMLLTVEPRRPAAAAPAATAALA